MAKPLYKNIPNLFTSLNLLAGCIAIVMALESYLLSAAFLIMLAAVFDFLDGALARALKAYSGIGKNLDSLADVVSFGVAPGVLVYNLILMSLTKSDYTFSLETANMGEKILLFSGFLVTVFSAYRLARFNVEQSGDNHFTGLPTPAAAIFYASLTYILLNGKSPFLYELLLQTWVQIILVLFISFMLVSRLPMFSLKFKNYAFNENQLRYLLITVSVILLFFFGFEALAGIILLYILISFSVYLFGAGKKKA